MSVGGHVRGVDGAAEDAGPLGLPRTGVVLIGTGESVRALATQMAGMASSVVPVGCVLVNRIEPRGAAGEHAGVLPPVLGFADDLIGLHAKWRFRAAVVSIPASRGEDARRVKTLLKRLEVDTRVVPPIEDLLRGEVHGSRGASVVDPAALIGRTHWGVDRAQVGAILRGKRVLITGAGGSIGGELARVCAGFEPSGVILMERAENALFEIDQQMARRFPGVARRAVLNDVVDADATARLVASLKPDVIFHAAAHKHVPLMEDHPSHALNNNLFGTRSIVDAAVAAGVGRLVMISSDKAVNPTSVMGATKRLAEMYIQGLAGVAPCTRLSMVRFGNVLASACSVIPIWSQQLAEGHALTVTDPRMTRYFMTIPEAATLVVQAGALHQPTQTAPVYVLDMGEPVSILRMAVRFLRQHGLEASVDEASVPPAAWDAPASGGTSLREELDALRDEQPDAVTHPILFTGARPGEKLFEELAYGAEMLLATSHKAIGQWRAGTSVDVGAMIRELETLRSPTSDKSAVVEAIRRWVPEMKRA